MTATIIEKYDADAGDNTIPVLSNDPTLLTAIAFTLRKFDGS